MSERKSLESGDSESSQLITETLNAMTPVVGEMRAVYCCEVCGQYVGRRFIPYGLGYGMTVNACLCYAVTGSQVLKRVAEVTP